MKVLATLLKKQSGEVTICGIPVEEAAKVRRITGYLPQDFSMYPNMGVYEAMDYLGALSGLSRQTRKERIPVLLKKVNLQDEYRTKVRALSGGMKRRLGIAQAILHEPKVLIVDEPTAGLDPNERIRFRNLLSGLARERMVLLSTHIVSDVESIAGQIILMDEGKIVDSGSPADIIASVPVTAWTCRMSGEDGAQLAKQYQVSNMKTVADGMELRILSDKRPCQDAVQTDLTLEDTFLYYFGEKGGEEDLSLIHI